MEQYRYLKLLLIASSLIFVKQCFSKPIVDPGLFMILGVETCRNGSGYCLLGVDCTLDEEFVADDTNGHCDGLKSAFTPVAHFTCCKYKAKNNSHIRPDFKRRTTTTTEVSAATENVSVSTSTASTTQTAEDNTVMTTDSITTTIQPDPTPYLDVNNEVIKEVTPPSLNEEQNEEETTTLGVAEINNILNSDNIR